jgi:hypothetical protein
MEPTIKTLEIKGDAFAMGQQLGRASADFMQNRIMASRSWQMVQEWKGSDVLCTMEQMARWHFPQYVHEIEGLADGAGVDFDDIFAWHCRGELLGRDAYGCTTLAVPTPEGAVFAHNEDAMELIRGHCLLIRAQPEEGLAYTGFVYPGYICGNCFFVNAAGIAHSINNISAKPAPIGLPRHIISRAIVDARTIEEVVNLLKRTNRASGYHHMVAQAGRGPALSIEAPASGCSVKTVDLPLAHTNHLIHEAFAGVEHKITPSSVARQERAQTLISRLPAGVGVKDLLAILADKENETLPIYCDQPKNSDDVRTVATATFEVSEKEVQWAVYDDLSAPPLYQGTETVRKQHL